MTSRLKNTIITAVILLIGLVFIGYGTATLLQKQTDNGWTVTSAKVVTVSNIATDQGNNYTAVLEYVVDGQSYRVTDTTAAASAPKVGSSRSVAYNPEAPYEAKVVASKVSPLISYGALIIGLICVLFGGLRLLMPKRHHIAAPQPQQLPSEAQPISPTHYQHPHQTHVVAPNIGQTSTQPPSQPSQQDSPPQPPAGPQNNSQY